MTNPLRASMASRRVAVFAVLDARVGETIAAGLVALGDRLIGVLGQSLVRASQE